MKKDQKKNLTILVISFGTIAMYGLPFMKSVFYDPMRTSLNITHTELGNLLSLYGLIALLGYIPGGWLADKYSAKKLVLFSLVSSGLLGFYFSTFPSYNELRFIFIGWGITTATTFFAGIVKVIRMLGGTSEQGRYFGFFEGFQGLGGAIISFIGLYLFDKFADVTIGFKAVVWIHSILCIVSGIILYFIIEEKKVESDDKVNIKDIPKVLKMPKVWLIALIVFSVYMNFSSITYLSPYLTDVFHVSLGLVAFLSIIRTFIIRMAGGPLLGFIADKVGSPTKVLFYSSILIAISELAFLLMPNSSILVYAAIVNMLFATILLVGGRGIYFATVEEAKIPLRYTGVAVGVISTIGFSPDAFYWIIGGYWLDHYGTLGYKYLFILSIVSAVIGTISSLILLKIMKDEKLKGKRKLTEENTIGRVS